MRQGCFQLTGACTLPGNCQDVKEIFEVLGRFVQVRRPGEWLVDVFPQLASSKLFDMVSNWRRVGRSFYEADRQVFLKFWNRMKEDIANGTAPHCFGKEFIQSDLDKHGIDSEQAAWIA